MPNELSGRQLDAAVAVEVFAHDVKEGGGRATWRYRPKGWRWWQMLPYYSTSLDDASGVEAEIETRGLWEFYIHYLIIQVKVDGFKPCYDEMDLWQICRATPEQICRAALAAVRGAKP